MKQYLDVLQKILDKGVEKESGRANMPNTIGISKADIEMNLQDGFPLLTTKKLYTKAIIYELLWFLHGDCNIKYLVDNNVNIWNGDAYRWYLKYCTENICEPYFTTIESFVDGVKNYKRAYFDSMNTVHFETGNFELDTHLEILFEANYILGDMGKIYGYQWRNQNGVDQVKDVIDGLQNSPFSRYHIIDAWNKSDFREMALPPCHLLYQFIVRPLSLEERIKVYASREGQTYEEFKSNWDTKEQWLDDLNSENIPKFYLDLNMYQRSCDTFLGVPFNIASMSILLMIFAQACGMLPGVANWIGGDTHLYVDHIPMVMEQLKRTPTALPQLKINKELNSLEDILELKYEDFELVDYFPQDTIKAELFTGLKKS